MRPSRRSLVVPTSPLFVPTLPPCSDIIYPSMGKTFLPILGLRRDSFVCLLPHPASEHPLTSEERVAQKQIFDLGLAKENVRWKISSFCGCLVPKSAFPLPYRPIINLFLSATLRIPVSQTSTQKSTTLPSILP